MCPITSPKKPSGFTLVELLIVVSIMAILTVAVVSAINPLEQLRKARDTQRKADAATLLSAHDRFLATFGCYSWYWVDATKECDTSLLSPVVTPVAATESTFDTLGQFNYDLEQKQELKIQFKTRSTIKQGELFVSEDGTTGQISVCFTPESQSARQGGLGPLVTWANVDDPTVDCDGSYSKGDATCAVCVPQ